ncbi:MAG: hypothetical protein ACLFOY_12030 [Desulfatibacillaceae bacterium]
MNRRLHASTESVVPDFGEAKIADLVRMDDPFAVLEEVRTIFHLMFPEGEFAPVRRVFDDVRLLFAGNYPGYRACNTRFHDLQHTTDCFIAMARLLHGAWCTGVGFEEKSVIDCLVASLLHDTGYIQTEEEVVGTGARYTQVHVQRSIAFMKRYFKDHGYTDDEFRLCRQCLECTGLDVNIEGIPFKDDIEEMVGHMLGTADLLGQLGDRTYLEKLLFLYREFKEAGIPGFVNEQDLLKKTEAFYQHTNKRFSEELADVRRFIRPHFATRWGIDRDLYAEAIRANMTYLRYVMDNHEDEYRSYLRRGGYVKAIEFGEKHM